MSDERTVTIAKVAGATQAWSSFDLSEDTGRRAFIEHVGDELGLSAAQRAWMDDHVSFHVSIRDGSGYAGFPTGGAA